MLVFSPLSTRRLTVRLRELTIGNAIYLCKLRPDLQEVGTTALLRFIVEEETRPRVGQVTDVLAWTVHERAMVVAHYLAHSTDGGPDFQIGDGRFSDYFLEGADVAPESLLLGEHGGDVWHLRPLIGYHVEAIERLMACGKLESCRLDWWFGAMAAQLHREGEPDIDPASISAAQYDQHLLDRVEAFRAFPERDFMLLLTLFLSGQERLDHLFRLDFADDGLIFLPTQNEAQEVPGLPPARFRFIDAVAESTLAVFGKPAQPSR